MSTEWCKIKSDNSNFPNDTLEFITGVSGNYFCIEYFENNKSKSNL